MSGLKLSFIVFLSGLSLAFVACSAPEDTERREQAIIECNGGSVGQVCDTDDDPCTQEICVQQGQNVFCALEQLAPDGTACLSDNLPCTADTCQAGECTHSPLPEGTLCNDGLFCTSGERCNALGVCGQGESSCDDGNPCTLDSCDEALQQCGADVQEGMECDDNNLCTNNTQCDSQGECSGGEQILCSDGSGCTADTCDPSIGCQFPPLTDTACDDNFFCTSSEMCSEEGVCEGQATCNDDNPCTEDLCIENEERCENPAIPGGPCNDGNSCTLVDACRSDGSCDGSPAPDGTPCTNAGGCMTGGTCEEGECLAATPLPDGSACDDENACTLSDVCGAGECSGLMRSCSDGDPCTADSCDPLLGCVHQPIDGCTPGADAGLPDAGALVDGGPRSDAGPLAPDAGPAPVLGGGGCNGSASSSTGLSALFLVIIAFGWRLRHKSILHFRASSSTYFVLTLLAALHCLGGSRAFAEGFDSELFDQASSDSYFFSQSKASTLPKWHWNLGVALNLSTDPLVLRDAESGEPVPGGVVVSKRRAAAISGAIGIWRGVEVGFALPIILSQLGSDQMLQAGREFEGSSLGDLRLDAKRGFWNFSDLRLSFALSTTLPTGDSQSLHGESGPTFVPRAIAGYRFRGLEVAANLGLRMRSRQEVGVLEVGSEMLFGAGASLQVWEDSFWLLSEFYASRTIIDGRAESTPAEALFGFRYAVHGPYQVNAALGFGIGSGVGTPALRTLISFAYAPAIPKTKSAQPKPQRILTKKVAKKKSHDKTDPDQDGITDKDQCPNDAEDKDDFEDEDGCPDKDNDGDKIADSDDDCPNRAEIINGIADEDGCPDEGVIVMKEDRVVLEEQVLFDLNRARVKRDGRKALQAILRLYRQHPEWKAMRVEGHADTSGPESYNQELSQRRAERVVEAMIALGMKQNAISGKGFGSTKPRVSGENEEAMRKNRRVEFVVINQREEVEERIIVDDKIHSLSQRDSAAPSQTQ